MGRLALAAGTVWRRAAARELRSVMRDVSPDIVHFHNTFPLISPAAYYAVAAEGLPVVQTLPNFRLLCAKATFFRDGSVCEDCMGRHLPLAAIRHACYRGSAAASAAVGTMQVVHRMLGTWRRKVDCFLVPSDFVRNKFIEAGFEQDQVVVKFNLTEDQGNWQRTNHRQGALFVGRLSEEKGLHTLMSAWKGIPTCLDVLGDGPLEASLKREAPNNVRFLGATPRSQVINALRETQFLVVPSEWYETFGLVIIEAFSVGTPVIVSRLAAPEEIVDDGLTGLHFSPGDPDDLAAKVGWATTHPEEMRRMGAAAREVYEERYTPDKNYTQLMSIYLDVINGSGHRQKNRTKGTKERVEGI